MAYLATIGTPVIKPTGEGVKFVTWEITETDVAAGEDAAREWVLPGVPAPCELYLVEVELTDPDAATTTAPILATGTAADTDSTNDRVSEEGAAAHHRIASDARIAAFGVDGATIYGRSVPDAHANTITTRLTIRAEE